MKIQSAKAGIGTGRAGLQAASGLFSSAGLFQKGVKSFNPLDLDPYLLFDAETSMLGTLEAETLDLDPANPSSLDVITATRSGTTATYTDSSGLIQVASADTVRVDHTQGEQLTPTVYQRVGYTDFSQGWIDGNGATVSGTGSYNGSVTKEITAVGYSTYFTAVSTTASQIYNVSFYARIISGSASSISIYRQHTETSFTTISLTSEWQRFDVAVTASGSSVNFGIAKTSGATDPVVFEITQPQFTESAELRDFVANTTGSPLWIASPTFGPRVPMILVEPSATNLFRNSQDLTASPNSISKATITQESETFKGQPVFRLTDDTSSGEHRLSIIPASVTASRVIVHFFVKADTCTKFCITYPTAGDAGAAWNLQSGSALGSTVGSAVAQTIEDAGDGWFKVSMTYDRPTATATGHNIQTLQDSATSAANRNYQGDGTLSFLMTMPQLEYGETQTSFIPTSGSAVTRAADDLVISGSAFTDFYNPSEGTVYVESTPFAETGYIWSINDGSYTNRIYSFFDSSVRTRHYVREGNASFEYTASPSALGEISRNAFSFKANNAISSVDGTSSPPDSSVTLPSGLDRLSIGQAALSTFTLNGHIKRLIYWPTHSDSL